MPTFSRDLEETLHRALNLATQRRQEFATLEHLLLSLTEDSDAVAVLRACNVEIEKLKTRLIAFLDDELSVLVAQDAEDAKPTLSFQRAVQRALFNVQSSGREEVSGANVLVAIFSERESNAVYFLQEQDMTRLDAVSYISHGIAKAPGRTLMQMLPRWIDAPMCRWQPRVFYGEAVEFMQTASRSPRAVRSAPLSSRSPPCTAPPALRNPDLSVRAVANPHRDG